MCLCASRKTSIIFRASGEIHEKVFDRNDKRAKSLSNELALIMHIFLRFVKTPPFALFFMVMFLKPLFSFHTTHSSSTSLPLYINDARCHYLVVFSWLPWLSLKGEWGIRHIQLNATALEICFFFRNSEKRTTIFTQISLSRTRPDVSFSFLRFLNTVITRLRSISIVIDFQLSAV